MLLGGPESEKLLRLVLHAKMYLLESVDLYEYAGEGDCGDTGGENNLDSTHLIHDLELKVSAAGLVIASTVHSHVVLIRPTSGGACWPQTPRHDLNAAANVIRW